MWEVDLQGATISARIPSEINQQITLVARSLRRSRSWVINEALRGYVQAEAQFIEAVQDGIRAADEGRLIPHEKVVQEIGGMLAANRTRATSR